MVEGIPQILWCNRNAPDDRRGALRGRVFVHQGVAVIIDRALGVASVPVNSRANERIIVIAVAAERRRETPVGRAQAHRQVAVSSAVAIFVGVEHRAVSGIVVDLAIAVVIQAVADLVRWSAPVRCFGAIRRRVLGRVA